MAASTQISQDASRAGVRVATVMSGMRARYMQWRLYRRTLAEMASLSNRDLADLGLHRSELRRVAYMAAYRD